MLVQNIICLHSTIELFALECGLQCVHVNWLLPWDVQDATLFVPHHLTYFELSIEMDTLTRISE